MTKRAFIYTSARVFFFFVSSFSFSVSKFPLFLSSLLSE